MSTRHLRTIPTPWAPYSVTFSRDGTRLAFGGGSFYGHGGIHILELDGDRCTPLNWEKVPWVVAGGIHPVRSMYSGVPTVSGLAFSDDDRFLAASMWGAGRTPAMLFQVSGTELDPFHDCDENDFDQFITPNDDEQSSGRGIHTGVVLHQSFVIVRQHGGHPAGRHVVRLCPLPPGCTVRADQAMQHLTNSRLIVVRESVVTEAGGSRGLRTLQPDGSYARVPATEGLAIRSLRELETPPEVLPVEACPRITAIAALPGNAGFVTGGNQGQIDEWSWDGAWRQRRLRAPTASRVSKRSEEATHPESIEAIVVTAGTNQLVAVSLSGTLLTQRKHGDWHSERLPERGSPRSLAAHPHRPWVAVGIKQGGFERPESAIAMLALDEIGS